MKKILSLMLALVALLYPVSSFADAPATIGIVADPNMGECNEMPCMTFVPTAAPTCESNKMQVCERLGGVMTGTCECAWVNGFCLLDLDGNGRPESTEQGKCDEYIRKVAGGSHTGHGVINKRIGALETKGTKYDRDLYGDGTKDVPGAIKRISEIEEIISRADPKDPGVLLQLQNILDELVRIHKVFDGDPNVAVGSRVEVGVLRTIDWLVDEIDRRQKMQARKDAEQDAAIALKAGGTYYGVRLGLCLTAQPRVELPILVQDADGNPVDTDGDGNADTENVLGRGGFAIGPCVGIGGGYADETRRFGGVFHLSPVWEKGSNSDGEETTDMGIVLGVDLELMLAVSDDNALFLGPVVSFEHHATGAQPSDSELSSWDVGAGPGLRWEVSKHVALVTNLSFKLDHYSTKVDGGRATGEGLAATLKIGFDFGYRPDAAKPPAR